MIIHATAKATGEVQEFEISEAELKRLMQDAANPRRFTIRDMATRYGKDPKTIHRWVKSKTVPYFKIGGTVFFDPREIERMEQQGTIAAAVLHVRKLKRKTLIQNSPRS